MDSLENWKSLNVKDFYSDVDSLENKNQPY